MEAMEAVEAIYDNGTSNKR